MNYIDQIKTVTILYGYLSGFIVLLIIFIFKFIMAKIIELNLKKLDFITLPFKYFFFRKVNKISTVLMYSPVVDKKNISYLDALKEDKQPVDPNSKLRKALQIQDDQLINRLNVPLIYFNPNTLEVYGSFFTFEKENPKYFKARLELLEDKE